MRECKPSDIQALEAIYNSMEQFCLEITMLRGKVSKLKNDIKTYIQEQQEPINVQTTHGFPPNDG
jgi:flagellar hook-associated protein FlgK